MSPEQVRGEVLDARTDLFSLGVVLYEMATGRQAFSGTTTGVVFEGILNREPPPPSDSNPAAPAQLDQIVSKALEKDKDVRYQTARDLLADLKRLRRDTTSGRKAGLAASAAVSGSVVTSAPARVGARLGSRRRQVLLASGALVAVVGLGALAYRAVAVPSALRIKNFVQITSDHLTKQGRPLTDGTRLYFSENLGTSAFNSVVAQVTVTGGDVARIPVPFPGPFLVDISPDGTELLVLANRENLGTVSTPAALWIVPVLGGTPRPVGDVRASDAAWSPDGRTIAYTAGADLSLVGRDASNPRKIWTSRDRAFNPVWAPDGRRLRLSVFDSAASRSRIWEVRSDGGDAHPILQGFDPSLSPCCGRWTPDGRHYVFAAGRERQDLWVLTESWLSRGSREPVRLTQGPLNYGGPLSSRDGRKLFANGWQESGELVRCPLGSGECATFLGGIDAWGMSFSKDGQWVAYVLADGALWRSRADGTEKLQLTFPPVSAALPQWSPDGQQIAYFTLPISTSRLFLVPSNGGPAKEAVPEGGQTQMDANWSADGRRLVFGRAIGMGPEDRDITIQIADLATGEIKPVPDSKGLFSPRWSPDGRYLAAISHDSLRLLLYEFSSQRWRPLVAAKTIVGYPSLGPGQLVAVLR